MKILLTGAKGFIGKNLTYFLKEAGHEVLCYDLGDESKLEEYVSSSDFIINLAGVNRPLTKQEFYDGNLNFSARLLDTVAKVNSKSPIILSSSTKASEDSDYGKSKKMAEDLFFQFAKENNHPVYVFRLYNVFGKWCRPNYNSVIATWCYNITHNLPLEINQDAPAIDFVYIDDVAADFISIINEDKKGSDSILYPHRFYCMKLEEIASLLESFKESRKNHMVPDISTNFAKDLYSTYLSYLDEDNFTYSLDTHKDYRGSFTEVLKTFDEGQISVNVSKPGITKGNHYHHTKNEKFLVVSGTCVTKLRKIDSDKIISIKTSGDKLEVIDIPPGYTHCITNVGKSNSVTLMWANELYDKSKPDTFFLKVENDEQKI